MAKTLFYRVIFLLLVTAILLTSFGQAVSQDLPPLAVVQGLFDGMQKGDSAIVHSTFDKEVSVATIFRNKEDEPIIKRQSSVQDFLAAIGTPHKEIWYEEIWDVKVDIDGDLAQVWCNYAFYLDNNFSHCGVDALQLHHGKDGWKIYHLADTRRKTNCTVPQSIKDKHNGN